MNDEEDVRLSINPLIRAILRKNNIFEADGIMLLIAAYFNLKPSCLKDETNYYHQIWNKILTLNIFVVDYTTDTLEWCYSLFGDSLLSFEDQWIKDFMNKFKEVNPERRGDKAAVVKNLKKLTREYPYLTKEKIMEVTDYYLNNLSDSQFCKKSHKFLYDTNGSVFMETFEAMKINYTNTNNNVI